MPWILISIVILLLTLFGLALFIKRGEKHEPDYRTFFILGIIWLPIGLATDNSALWSIGLALMAIGLINKGKWKKPKEWQDLSEKQRRIRVFLIFVLSFSFLLGVGLFLLTSS